VNFIWHFSDRNILSVVATICRKMKRRKTIVDLHINDGVQIYIDRLIVSG
jgi:hypothetical protein